MHPFPPLNPFFSPLIGVLNFLIGRWASAKICLSPMGILQVHRSFALSCQENFIVFNVSKKVVTKLVASVDSKKLSIHEFSK